MALPPRDRRLFPNPQRARDGLKPLRPGRHFVPVALGDIGLDRVSFSLGGTVTVEPNAGCMDDLGEPVSLEDYWEYGTGVGEHVDWFGRVNHNGHQNAPAKSVSTHKITQGLASQRRQTLGYLKIVQRLQRSRGDTCINLFIDAQMNPNRVIAHLYARFRDAEDFASTVSQLHWTVFFEYFEAVEKSLDDQDNWVLDWEGFRSDFGDDPFDQFLNLLVEKFQQFLWEYFEPLPDSLVEADGEHLVVRAPGITVRFNSNDIRIKQIETYFERRYSSAIAGMREASLKALDDFEAPIIRFFGPDRPGEVRRRGNGLQISAQTHVNVQLKIYAKLRNRVRFEVRRSGGDNAPPRQRIDNALPFQRLHHRLNLERVKWLDGLQWEQIMSLFADPFRPNVDDLAKFLSEVGQIAQECGVDAGPLIQHLIVDGGASFTENVLAFDHLSEQVRDRLVTENIIRRLPVRQRNSHTRYALTDRYLALSQELVLLPHMRDLLEE